ncbi:MAG: C40 family peptidase [Lachnospiraceae bacterium]|nr:C40 family peptidase [Lachnospiraceae bacterium]
MRYAIVNEPIVPLYRSAARTSSLEDEVLYGMKVEILETVADGMVRVRTPYQYEGIAEISKLTLQEDRIQAWEENKKVWITGRYVDIQSIPKYQGYQVISLPRGAVVRFLEPADENGWVKVGLANGRTGYCKESFVADYQEPSMDLTAAKANEEEFREAVCRRALSYLGTQYRWGGKTPLGIDCSGLCSTSYLMNGVVIFRDAKIKEGFPVKEIAYEEKKKGDLLFFPGHVAMYLGDGRYIHSTGKNGSDGVVINSLNPGDSDYREDLLKILSAVGSIF